MPTNYGNFEVVSELFKTTAGSVCSARWAETHDIPNTCLKVIELNDSMLENHDTAVAEELLLAAALQQTMANKSEFWAPIFELGSNGTNAYYAGKLYPRSLQTLIDTKICLTAAELKIILTAIIDGLIDLDTAYHRQHGNLKPGNVLLGDKVRITSDGVFLADPDATGNEVASLTRAPDTKALGQILYSLVTHKPITNARLPLQKSEAWKEIGSSGPRWFALCEALLDTFSQQGLPSLESIRLRVGEIRPTHRRISRTALAVLFFVAAGAGGYWHRAELEVDWRHGHDAAIAMINQYFPKTSAPSSMQPATLPSPDNHPSAPDNAVIVETKTPPQPTVIPTVHIPSTQPTIPRENTVVTAIKSAATPEMHSTIAEQEFEHDRDAYLAQHAPPAAPANLVEWSRIYRSVRDLDLLYPQPQILLTAPISLITELTARRDAELTRAVDAIFNQDSADPTTYTTTLTDAEQTNDAATVAHRALGKADLTVADASVKDFQQKLDSLESVDASASAAFDAINKEFQQFTEAKTSTDRAALLIAAANDSLPLSIRLQSWLRLSKAGVDAWPADLPALATDRAQGDHLADFSRDIPATRELIATEQKNRLDAFFASLRDEAAVRDAVKQASDLQLSTIAPLYPQWFQYDIALAGLKDVKSPPLSADQIAAFLDLADKVHAPTAKELRSAFTEISEPMKDLAVAGPAGITGWKLAPGSNAEHRIYILGDQSLEFLRVQQPATNGGEPVDCYLSTTEVPISLLQKILDKDHPTQRQAAQTLNEHQQSASPAMAIWSFAPDGIKLDDRDYKNCFLLAPTSNLPAQFVTPEMALYVARLVGCRLPTTDEWRGALAQVSQPTADPNLWGFAMRNWKLRDSDFLAAMNRASNSKPPQYWPDDNIFHDPIQTSPPVHAQDMQIWSTMDLATLAGHIAPVANTNLPTGDDALPMAPDNLGFREVDDGAHYTGVFHDLIGNAAEIVLDVQPGISENLDITENPTDKIKTWLTPDRQTHLAIIGGSALSSPTLDPRTAYPLPLNAPIRAFADVGFRLAFSNPESLAIHDPAKLRALAIAHAAMLTEKAAE